MNKPVPETIKSQIKQQRHFFRSGETRSIDFRLNQLHKLKETLKNNEQRFFDTLKQDLQRTSFETYGTELGLIYEEINLVTKKLKKWSRPRKVSGSLINFPSKIISIPNPTVLV